MNIDKLKEILKKYCLKNFNCWRHRIIGYHLIKMFKINLDIHVFLRKTKKDF